MNAFWLEAKEPIIFILIILFWAASAVIEAIKKKRRQKIPEPVIQDEPNEAIDPRDPEYIDPVEAEFQQYLRKQAVIPEEHKLMVPETVQSSQQISPIRRQSPHLLLNLRSGSLAQAVVLKEILDKPVSMRR